MRKMFDIVLIPENVNFSTNCPLWFSVSQFNKINRSSS